MLPEEYKILKHLHDNGGKCPIEYLDTLDDSERLVWDGMHHQSKGWVGYADGRPNGLGSVVDFKSVIITEKGTLALLEEEMRLDQARKEADETG